jgi:hypothetical protein
MSNIIIEYEVAKFTGLFNVFKLLFFSGPITLFELSLPYTRSVRKICKTFFLCGILVNLNETRLHEATLNLHTHT